jgi:hypothetical protein
MNQIMKRDWDLLRWLLSEAESADAGFPIVLTNGVQYTSAHYTLDIGERGFTQVYEHILLLGDSGLAEVRDLGRMNSGPSGAVIDRLTMAGHDFLSAARNPAWWTEAMKKLKEKGVDVPVNVLIQVLSAIAKQHLGLS